MSAINSRPTYDVRETGVSKNLRVISRLWVRDAPRLGIVHSFIYVDRIRQKDESVESRKTSLKRDRLSNDWYTVKREKFLRLQRYNTAGYCNLKYHML